MRSFFKKLLLASAVSLLSFPLFAGAVPVLIVPQGGTGQSTFPLGNIIVGNGVNALSSLSTTSLAAALNIQATVSTSTIRGLFSGTGGISYNSSTGVFTNSGVTAFNTRTGAVTLTSGDVTTALTYTPYNSTNPSGYITSGGAPVQSVFGRTGAVVANSGDYTTSQVTEGSNLYYTSTRFDTAFSGKSTTNLAEGTNLYFTNARAQSAIDGTARTLTGLTLSGITGTTNCLQANTSGVVSGTGAACGSGSGGVTSVALSAPTGLSVTGSPITTSGTLALSLTAGYNIPLTASTTNWNSFYNTPSSIITAGNGLSWTGNTLNGFSTTTIRGFVAVTAPLIYSSSTGVFSITQASSTSNGYLSSTDYSTFFNKQYPLSTIFPIEKYGAVCDGVTDDTTAIQNTINAAEVVSGVVMFQSNTCVVSNTLLINKEVTIEGTASYSHYGPLASSTEAVNIPTQSPYLSGAVIMMTAANKDIFDITATGVSVNFYNIGLRFSTSIMFKTTGHGVYWLPAIYSGTTRDSGPMGAEFKNVNVFGTDGNHYAFWFVNPLQLELDHISGYGGGGLAIETNGTYNINHLLGNVTSIANYFNTMVAGSGHAYYLKNTSGETILMSFIRPQAWVRFEDAPIFGVTAPSGGQHTFYVDSTAITGGSGTASWLTMIAPDLETDLNNSGPINIYNGVGENIGPGIINDVYGGGWTQSDSDGFAMGNLISKLGSFYTKQGEIKIGGVASIAPAGGQGLELFHLSNYNVGGVAGDGVSDILSYNRDTSQFKDLQFEGRTLGFRSGGTEQLRISTTSVLSENLFRSTLPSGGFGEIAGFGANGANDLMTFSYANSGVSTIQSSPFGALNIQTQSNQGINIIAGTGNIGIGNITDPDFPIEFSANSGSPYITAALRGSSATTRRAALLFRNVYGGTKNNAFEFGTDLNVNGSNDFYIYDSLLGALRYYVNSSGNTGIGTSSPAFKLDVGGSIHGTSYYSSDGTIGSSTTTGGATFKNGLFVSGTITGGTGTSSGTVTSVAETVPTGLTVSGSPITTSGTLAIALQSGYIIPTTASSTNYDTFYGTPSTRITAGTGLAWTGNTLNNPSIISTGSAGQIPFYAAGGTTLTATSTIFIDSANKNVNIGSSNSTATGTVTFHYNPATPSDNYFGIYDANNGIKYGLSTTCPTPTGLVGLCGYYKGMGISGSTNTGNNPIFGVLNSSQSSNGIGNTAFTVYDSNRVVTYNNVLDDGAGRVGIGSSTPAYPFVVASVASPSKFLSYDPATTGTSTIAIGSASTSGRIILRDTNGTTCTAITTLTGVMTAAAITCP